MFGWLKENRSIITCADKFATGCGDCLNGWCDTMFATIFFVQNL